MSMPFRGIYLSGGIAPKIINLIKKSDFLKKFRDKGRMSDVMKSFPVYIINNTDIGLIGCRNYALNEFNKMVGFNSIR